MVYGKTKKYYPLYNCRKMNFKTVSSVYKGEVVGEREMVVVRA